ncbi:MAG TPA: type II secretion system major pseudopilin GspG [Bryobacteraceae bacterium]|nr:type II secretion system major pseudopilin GspG [Bryobacteraceae bacterium]
MNDRRRLREAGITLIEMLVVVTIIALFAGLVLLPMMKKVDVAKRTAARTQINGFMTALGTYKLDTGTYPTTEQGLHALREKPEGVNGWQGPYLQKDLPKDPWKSDYVYKFPGDHGDEPDIISYGLDGKPGGEGNDKDITSWENE